MLVLSRKPGESILAKGDIHPDDLDHVRSIASDFVDRGDTFSAHLIRRLVEIVDEGVGITVLEASGKIRIGIKASDDIKILRTELIKAGAQTPCLVEIPLSA